MKHYLLITLCTLLYGCPVPEPAPGRTFITLEGDSLMRDGLSHITAEITYRDNAPFVIANAKGGAAMGPVIEYGEGRISALEAHITPAMRFVSMGGNSRPGVYYPNVTLEPSLAPSIDRYMAAVNPSTQVYWIEPHAHVPNADGVRAIIREAAGRHSNMHVLVLDIPLNLTKADQGDPLHLKPAGNARLAKLIADVVFGGE